MSKSMNKKILASAFIVLFMISIIPVLAEEGEGVDLTVTVIANIVADAGGPYYGRPGVAITFDGTGSSDPDGSIETYAWVFGDGGTEDGPTPSHTYTVAGVYTVTLTVTDDDGLTDSDTATVTVRTPTPPNERPVADAGLDQTAYVDETVDFSGADSYDTDGTVVGYEWSFGDGETASGVEVSHAYSEPSSYTVTLTVEDNKGAVDMDTCLVTVTEAPETGILNIDTEPVKGEVFVEGESWGIAPQSQVVDIGIYSVSFGAVDGYVTPDPVEVEVKVDETTDVLGTYTDIPPDMGVLNIDTEPVKGEVFVDETSWGTAPQSQVVEAGTYSVSFGEVAGYVTPEPIEAVVELGLTTNIVGTYTEKQPPVADAGTSRTRWVDDSVSFDGSGSSDVDGTIVLWEWDFGDGSTGEGVTVAHTYRDTSTYTVTLTVTDNDGLTDTDTATLRIIEEPEDDEDDDDDRPSRPPVDDEVTPEEIEELPPDEAADILEELDVEDAADIIEELVEETAVEILIETNVTVAADILETVNETTVGDILDIAVQVGETATFSLILFEMEEDASAGVLLSADPGSGAAFIENMAEENLTETARIVEAAIKLRVRELDPEAAEELLGRAAEMLEEVTPQSLVDLFIMIAGFPATPSSVADILEVMDLNKVMEVIELWVSTDALQELADVFGYLTRHALSSIYLGMTSAEQATIYSYLSAETIANLPTIITPPLPLFIDNLVITPEEVELGEDVTISFDIMNPNNQSITYYARIKVGEISLLVDIELDAYESKTVTRTLTPLAEGTIDVTVDGLAGSFTVIVSPPPPTPAEFVVSELTALPTEIEEGGTVMISVTVTNIGETEGSYTVEFKVDGETVESETVTIPGDSVYFSSFEKTWSAGTYQVSVEDLTAGFTVSALPEPDFTIYYLVMIIIIVAIVALVAYWLWKRKMNAN